MPVGDPHRAYRRVLKRAWKAEEELRRVQAELDALQGTQQHEGQT